MEIFEKNDSRTHYCGTLTKANIGVPVRPARPVLPMRCT